VGTSRQQQVRSTGCAYGPAGYARCASGTRRQYCRSLQWFCRSAKIIFERFCQIAGAFTFILSDESWDGIRAPDRIFQLVSLTCRFGTLMNELMWTALVLLWWLHEIPDCRALVAIYPFTIRIIGHLVSRRKYFRCTNNWRWSCCASDDGLAGCNNSILLTDWVRWILADWAGLDESIRSRIEAGWQITKRLFGPGTPSACLDGWASVNITDTIDFEIFSVQ